MRISRVKEAENASRSNGSPEPPGDGAEPAAANLLTSPRPLTTGELARMIGMSPTFIREEIHGGYLHAVVVGRGRKRVYRIPATEAYRYIKALGIL